MIFKHAAVSIGLVRLSMESQLQNPEIRNNPENFQPYIIQDSYALDLAMQRLIG